jgi:hypothetical protein
MSSNFVYNTLNKLLDSNINILYEPNQSLFDVVFPEIDATILRTESASSKYFYYDAYVTSNFFSHVNYRNKFLHNHQTQDVVIFHQKTPNVFKKEDKTILRNNLSSAYKIFPTSVIADEWGMQDKKSITINYGIPSIKHELIPFKNRNTVLFMNFNDDTNVNNLFASIKTFFPDAILINKLVNNSLEETLKLISNYKIVIDLAHPFNALCATACGCFTVTNQISDDSIKSCLVTQNFRDAKELLSDIINNANTDLIEKDKEYIIMNYSMNIFIDNMTKLFNRIKMEPFII